MLNMFYKEYVPMDVGERIYQRRNELGKTQDELAEFCDKTRQTVAKWEHGDITISVNDFLKICNFLECDPGYLLGEFKTTRHITKDIQDVTKLSQDAAETVAKLDTILIEVLSCLLSHSDIQDILHQIFRAALEKTTYSRLLELTEQEQEQHSGARIAGPNEIALKTVAFQHCEYAELQCSKLVNKLLDDVIISMQTSESVSKWLPKNVNNTLRESLARVPAWEWNNRIMELEGKE